MLDPGLRRDDEDVEWERKNVTQVIARLDRATSNPVCNYEDRWLLDAHLRGHDTERCAGDVNGVSPA